MADQAHLHACPCCGNYTLLARGANEICEVCLWEDDGRSEAEAAAAIPGPNARMTLSRARESYRRCGASAPWLAELARAPLPHELPGTPAGATAVPTAPAAPARPIDPRRIVVPLLAGAAVSVAIGVYGRVHDPTGQAIPSLFFTATINLKVWFAALAAALGAFQLASALRMYGRISIPASKPPWLGAAHRWSGRVAIALTVPVAYHCLWALGFQSYSTRVLVHSLLGSFFYGAFIAKVVTLRRRTLPRWGIPLFGGLAFAALVGLFLTSSLWFFLNVSFPGF